VNVYGNDYDTIDGTGLRDYVDVCDLVEAHIRAYEKLDIEATLFCIQNRGAKSQLRFKKRISDPERIIPQISFLERRKNSTYSKKMNNII
jgi:UDP-glucose 4-epimerase